MKQRNPTWGCPRIAQQITLAFGIPMNKDVVRRILAARYHQKPDAAGPSWLTVLGQAKDSLWSVDLFRCESLSLRAHWVVPIRKSIWSRISTSQDDLRAVRAVIRYARQHTDVVGPVVAALFKGGEGRGSRDGRDFDWAFDGRRVVAAAGQCLAGARWLYASRRQAARRSYR
jgi:hypothetical protein